MITRQEQLDMATLEGDARSPILIGATKWEYFPNC